jgi:hypothetical protein
MKLLSQYYNLTQTLIRQKQIEESYKFNIITTNWLNFQDPNHYQLIQIAQE